MPTPTSNPVTREPAADDACPRFAGFSHVSLPVRDVDEACRFWTEVLGAEPAFNHHRERFAELRVGGIILGLSRHPSGWTGRTPELPHPAFFVNPEGVEG